MYTVGIIENVSNLKFEFKFQIRHYWYLKQLILKHKNKIIYWSFVHYGKYNSVLFDALVPTTNTFPLVNTVVVCPYRLLLMFPITSHTSID